jgi:hypothetical protein
LNGTHLRSSSARAVRLRTEVTCHCPPRGALIPCALRQRRSAP